jgi:hypothetical protein
MSKVTRVFSATRHVSRNVLCYRYEKIEKRDSHPRGLDSAGRMFEGLGALATHMLEDYLTSRVDCWGIGGAGVADLHDWHG